MTTPMRFLFAAMFALGWAIGHYPAHVELDAAQESAAEQRGYLAGLTDGARQATINAAKANRCTWQRLLAVQE